MISEKENTRVSKFLSLVLRHQPETIGITLDEHGWVDLDTLIIQANKHGVPLTAEIVNHVVITNAKKRFALNESADKIRANQGHSVDVDLGYKPQTPPEILYHGTSKSAVTEIMKSGLDKRDRHHVHLSSLIETAMQVGQRHGVPHVFTVLAREMACQGHEFFLSDNGVWLTDRVPVEFLRVDKS